VHQWPHRSHANIAHTPGWRLAKKDGPQSEAVPPLTPFSSSDVDDRDDPVVAINDDDLIADDEVHVPAPLGMDLDERRGNRHHMHVTWHGGANAHGEVDVVDPRYIAAGQHRLPNLRALLCRQAHAAARLALLSLTLLAGLTLLTLLAGLTLLTLLPLRSLTLGLVSLLTLRLRLLVLLPLALAGGLIALLFFLATLLGLTLLALLRSGFSLTLRRLARGLPVLPALRLTLLAAILLRPLLMLTLGSLSCGLSFLAALRLALLLSLRGLLGVLRRRLRLSLGAAALLALHGLG
jgi:hypothetical protein